MAVRFENWEGDGNLRIAPYVRLSHSQTIQALGAFKVPSEATETLRFTLPESDEPFDEIGIEIEYFGRLKCLGRLFVSHFEIKGAGQTVIDPAQERQEWGAISRFTWNRGHWSLQDGQIHGHTAEDADLWTGHYYARDLTFTAQVTPLAGPSHLLSARVQGACRFYAGGFDGENLVLVKEDFGTTILAKRPFERRLGQEYSLSLSVKGERLELSVNGEKLLSAQDASFSYGMCGLRMSAPGRVTVGRLRLQEESRHGTD